MQPPSFVIAANELSTRAIEIEKLRFDAFDRMNELSERFRVESTAAYIHSHRDIGGSAFPRSMNEILEKVSREIVYRVPAHVLEGVENGRLARPGHSGDEQKTRRSPR
jgi:hypothetical protein